ncbi:MAG: ABC transporter permease [Cryobacterium sp.]|nr:ABC transporter permease [Cryobacterium sp.]MBX3089177.1 ABC transporter permease [Cryobacterium sp.]MCO5294384.1 ABC transporter permease [Homoserinimonas sp.]
MNENIETKTEGTLPGALQRIVNVARLHLVNKSSLFKVPIFVLGLVLIFNLVLAWTIIQLMQNVDPESAENYHYWSGGGSGFIVVYMLVIAVQSISMTFPFAQAYSVTRRDFYFGSILAYLALSVFYATLLSVLIWIENLTNGWWLNAQIFSIWYLGLKTIPEVFFVLLMSLIFFSFIGSAAAVLFVRFKAWGLVGFFAVIGVLALTVIVVPILTRTTDAVGAWFVTTGTIGISAWLLVPTVIAGIAGMLILRRATPVS